MSFSDKLEDFQRELATRFKDNYTLDQINEELEFLQIEQENMKNSPVDIPEQWFEGFN